MEDNPPSSVLDGTVVGIKFGMATRQEIVSTKYIHFLVKLYDLIDVTFSLSKLCQSHAVCYEYEKLKSCYEMQLF